MAKVIKEQMQVMASREIPMMQIILEDLMFTIEGFYKKRLESIDKEIKLKASWGLNRH